MGDVTMTEQSQSMLDACREMAYRAIDAMPEVLLSGPGGSGGVHADATFARLFGLDDEVVADWRIPHEQPELLMPVLSPPTTIWGSFDPTIRTARFVLWSGHATLKLDAEYADQLGIKWDYATCQATLLFLRYKRQL